MEAVVHSPFLNDTPNANETSLKAILQQGPFYMTPQVEGPQLM